MFFISNTKNVREALQSHIVLDHFWTPRALAADAFGQFEIEIELESLQPP